jgi:hypothetical protein
MKVKFFKSAKSVMIASIFLWGTTGALAFWAGKNYGLKGSTAGGKNGKGGSVDAFGRAINQMLANGKGVLNIKSTEDLLRAKGKIDPTDLAIWAASLSPADCAKNLEELQKLPAGAKRNAMLAALSNQWAKTDPKGFLDAAKTMTNPITKAASTATALTSMAAKDPQAALAWLKANPGATDAQNTQEYNAIIAGYAANDPAAAFNMVNTMPDGANANSPESRAKLSALQALISGVGAQGNYGDAAAIVAQLQPGQMQNQAYSSLVQQWAASSPADAAAWVAASNSTAGQMRNYDSMIASDWAASDPAAAAAWAAQTDAAQQTANGGGRGGRGNSLLATAVGTWVQEGDVDSAGAYLNSLPASNDKDQAVMAFVTSASVDDPAGAMQWAATITNPQLQLRAEEQDAVPYSQSDPAGWVNYLATQPPAVAQQLAAAAQQGAGFGGGFGGRRGGGGGFAGGAGGGGAAAGPTVITNAGGGRRGRRGGGGAGG